jgi:hypothetical protein
MRIPDNSLKAPQQAYQDRSEEPSASIRQSGGEGSSELSRDFAGSGMQAVGAVHLDHRQGAAKIKTHHLAEAIQYRPRRQT